MSKRKMKRQLLAVLAACASWSMATAVPACPATGSQSALANAVYHGIVDAPVQLENGRWEGEPYVEGGASRPSAGLVEGFSLEGDLDGDGQPETVVLLWQSSGGSGNFHYVAVMKNQDGQYLNVATAPVGDRVQIRGGDILEGIIGLDSVQQGEGDAACCPSQLARRGWVLDGARLTERETRVDGVLSLQVLDGTGWRLTDLGQRRRPPEEIEVTLSFSEGRISGHSGCSRFSASIGEGAAPGQVGIGPVMGTRMACAAEPMALESEFLEQLGRVDRFGFMAGGLLLTGSAGGRHVQLRFEAL